MVNTRCNVNVTFTSNKQASKENMDSCENRNKESTAAPQTPAQNSQNLTSVIIKSNESFLPLKNIFASVKTKGTGSVGIITFFKQCQLYMYDPIYRNQYRP